MSNYFLKDQSLKYLTITISGKVFFGGGFFVLFFKKGENLPFFSFGDAKLKKGPCRTSKFEQQWTPYTLMCILAKMHKCTCLQKHVTDAIQSIETFSAGEQRRIKQMFVLRVLFVGVRLIFFGIDRALGH